MHYDLLSEEEKDDMIVQTLRAQQMDHYTHSINAERYRSIIDSAEDGPWKERVAQLLAETEIRISEVESIVSAILPQIPPEDRKEAAVVRVRAAEAVAKDKPKAG